MAASGGTKACRLCLIMDCELISIHMQLENSMRSILGQNITFESGLPKYICSDCAEFLRRFKEFREKCLIAQTVLYQILKTAGQVTSTEIGKLNRKRLKLDTQITPVQEKILLESTSTEEITQPDDMEQVMTPTEEIPMVEVPSRPVTVKMELESCEMDTLEESESEIDDKSNVTFEEFEEESEVLLDTSNPLEENTAVKEEINEEFTLPPEHADISEGFNIGLPTIKSLKVELEADEASISCYHCERCCQGAAGAPTDDKQPPECPHGAGFCPFEFPSVEEYHTHAAMHRTYNCRRCSFSATDVETARHHRQQEHGDKMYSCCYCYLQTTNPSSFLSHVRKRHPLQVVCPPCGACCSSRRGLGAHTRRLHTDTHSDKAESASVKSKSKSRKKGRKKSKKTAKKEVQADPRLLCKKCRIQFSTAAAWRRHLDDGHILYEEEKPNKKPVYNYTIQTLQSAFEAVKNKEMGIRQACRFFNIPKTTLLDRLKHDTFRFHTKRGPSPIFNEKEEGILVDFVKSEGSLKPKAVLAEAAVLTKRLKREKLFKRGLPGRTWYANFLRRHPELKQYK